MTDVVFYCLDECEPDPNYVVQAREVPPPIHAPGCPNSASHYVRKPEHYEN